MPALYQRGTTGSEVKRIQRRLQENVYYLGPLDGIYDDNEPGLFTKHYE